MLTIKNFIFFHNERGTPALHLNEAADETAVMLAWVWFGVAIGFT